MKKSLHDLLYNTNLDLSLSVVESDPSHFTVRTRLGAPRILFGLLFGLPCLFLLVYALRQQGITLLVALVFCPPMAILAGLFGLTRQAKVFLPHRGTAVKIFQFLHLKGEESVALPADGVVVLYKRYSSGGPGQGCYFYCAEVEGLQGFAFSVARDEKRRDAFASALSSFLGYPLRDEGERWHNPVSARSRRAPC